MTQLSTPSSCAHGVQFLHLLLSLSFPFLTEAAPVHVSGRPLWLVTLAVADPVVSDTRHGCPLWLVMLGVAAPVVGDTECGSPCGW